jgi:hypothetical protein
MSTTHHSQSYHHLCYPIQAPFASNHPSPPARAVARGPAAALAIARDLGLPTPDPHPDWVELGRAMAFQKELWALYRPVTPPTTALLTDETIVCRCEEVTAGRLREEIEGGLVSVAALNSISPPAPLALPGSFSSEPSI